MPNLETSRPYILSSHPVGWPLEFLWSLPALDALFLELGFLIRFLGKIVNSHFVPQEVLEINLMRETH